MWNVCYIPGIHVCIWNWLSSEVPSPNYNTAHITILAEYQQYQPEMPIKLKF